MTAYLLGRVEITDPERYKEYMESNLWFNKRLKRLEIDKFECRLCGTKNCLEVHHKPDSYSKIPNESVEDDLTTLCVECHELITNRIRELRYSKQPIILETFKDDIRKVNNNGQCMANIEIPPYRDVRDNFPQRTTQ